VQSGVRHAPLVRLRLERRARGWTCEDVAEEIRKLAKFAGDQEPQCNGHMVNRWELGVVRPRPYYVRYLCLLFDLPAEELGLVPGQRHALPSEAEMERSRRELLKLAAATGLLAGLSDDDAVDRLLHAMRSGAVDQQTIAGWEQVTVSLSTLDREVVGPMTLSGLIRSHLQTLTGALRGGSLPAAARQQVCSLAGETLATGGWLRWNLGDHQGAGTYFRAAMKTAREAHDRALEAYVAGCLSGETDDPTARTRGRAALVDVTGASPHTQAWLLTLAADASAMQGDRDGFDRLSDRAEALLAGPDAETRRPRAPFFDPAYFTEEHAASLIHMGQPGAAREVLETTLGRATGRIRLWMMLGLARAAGTEGEPELACRYATEAWTGALAGQVDPVTRRLRRLPSEQLQPYRHTVAVRQYEELVLAQ
jgi:transcriptional regulator with XRE-family HTH domain